MAHSQELTLWQKAGYAVALARIGAVLLGITFPFMADDFFERWSSLGLGSLSVAFAVYFAFTALSCQRRARSGSKSIR